MKGKACYKRTLKYPKLFKILQKTSFPQSYAKQSEKLIQQQPQT